MENSRNLTATSEVKGAKRKPLNRFRLVASAVVIALATLVGIFVWRLRSEGELPDLGDPFDVTLARQPVVIPDRDNAFAAYANARIRLVDMPEALGDAARKADENALRWSKAKPDIRKFQEESRPALEIWREGSERSDALYHQPGDYSVATILSLMQEVYFHNALAALEGSRLEEQGKMAEAWVWYRAMLRSSRMVGRHAGLVERAHGVMMHELAAKRILRWAADPQVDAGTVRRGLDDALAADRLTAPISDTLKLEYLLELRELNELKLLSSELPLPGGEGGLLDLVVPRTARGSLQHFRFRATNDVERSRRVIRFLFTNWLAQVDKPAAERSPSTKIEDVYFYEFDRSASRAARDVSPETINRAIDETLIARWIFRPIEHGPHINESAFGAWEGDGFFARERKRRSMLIVKLAAELYRREKGQPAATAGVLLEGYLKELPEGVSRGDAIPAGID
jgi:hypothetical protein